MSCMEQPSFPIDFHLQEGTSKKKNGGSCLFMVSLSTNVCNNQIAFPILICGEYNIYAGA